MRVWCKGGKASFHVFFTSVSYIFVSILFYAFIASRFILVSLSWVQSLENALGHASEECERQANDGHIYEGKVYEKQVHEGHMYEEQEPKKDRHESEIAFQLSNASLCLPSCNLRAFTCQAVI